MRLGFLAHTGALALLAPCLALAKTNARACSAEETRCERAEITVSKLEKAPYDFDFDTGWLPASSPIQVRLVAKLHSRVQVELEGTLDATWPEPLTLSPKGKKEGGRIALDQGLEIEAQAKFSVTVGNQSFSWTGKIPGFPSVSLLAKGSQTFDSWAFEGARIEAKTESQRIATISLTDQIIPIPGISGGFALDGEITFSAAYATLRIGFDEPSGPRVVDLQSPATRLLITRAPAVDTSAFVHGELARQATLHFIPGFYFTILNKTFNLPLANIPVKLAPSPAQPFDFDPEEIRVPLPQIGPVADVDLGEVPVSVASTTHLGVSDLGEERLVIEASSAHPIAFVDTQRALLDPKQMGSIRVVVTPVSEGAFDVPVTLDSNDPLVPRASVHIRGVASRAKMIGSSGDEVGKSGGCGCHVEGEESPAPAWAGVGLLALALIRRRRQL